MRILVGILASQCVAAPAGEGADRFALTADTCSRTDVAIGGACAVTVRALAGGAPARILVTSDVRGGETSVPIALAAPAPTAPPVATPAPRSAALTRLLRAGKRHRLTRRLSGGPGVVEGTLTTRTRGRVVRVATARSAFAAAG